MKEIIRLSDMKRNTLVVLQKSKVKHILAQKLKAKHPILNVQAYLFKKVYIPITVLYEAQCSTSGSGLIYEFRSKVRA